VALAAPAYDLFFPAGYRPTRDRRTVVIERGETLHEIARELQRVGVIRSQVGFLVLARTMRLDRSVKAGQYSFRIGITVPSLLRALDRGMYGLNLVTIPEGLMVSETARLIERNVGIPATQIDSLAKDPDLLDSLGIGAPSLEGWLAPDSYEWLPGTSPEVILRTMVTRTRERVQRATAGYDSLPLGMNAHEVLTLASIVESESRAREERPRIARVYLNRLDRGMLLQADPTVGYALGRGPRSRLTFKDLRVVSPYNTYRHEGLPPGPICSPGAAAIEAVMNATPNINDLYFVARGEGRHIFAPTYEQHLANIAYVRGKQAAAARADNDDVVGADVDSTLPRPVISKPGTAQPPDAPRETPSTAAAAPAPAPAGAAAAGSAPLKGTLLTPKATIHTAGSDALSPTLVKPAAGDSTKPRPRAVAPALDPPASKPAGRTPADTAKSAPKSTGNKSAGASATPAGTGSAAKSSTQAATKPALTTGSKPAGTTAAKDAATKPAGTTAAKDAATKPAGTSAAKDANASPAKPAASGGKAAATASGAKSGDAKAPATSTAAKSGTTADSKAAASSTTAKPATKSGTKPAAAKPKPAARDTAKTQ
jgi:UPF0755 protein